jgi:hypothetical protein
MALLGLALALNTQLIRRGHDLRLPKSQAINVPLIARVALGIYVIGLLSALVWGWNRRERAGGEPWYSRLGVAGVAVLVLIGVGLALLAIPGRTTRDRPGEEGTSAVRHVAPAALAGLGYLPEEVNLVVGVHAAEALADPAGQRALEQLRIGGAGPRGLESWSGLKLAEMDHAVLGLTLDAQLVPRLTLVVQTRTPYAPEAVRTALKAGRATDRSGRELHRFTLEGLGLEAHLWFAGERTLVVARRPEDFDRIPERPRQGTDLLPPALRDFVPQRIGPAAQLWAAGHVEDWDKVGVSLALAGLLRNDWETLKKARTFGLGIICDNGLTLRASFGCADQEAARTLHDYLAPGDGGPGKGLPALGLRPEADPLARELAQTLKTVQSGAWVDVQARASLDAMKRPQTGKAP